MTKLTILFGLFLLSIISFGQTRTLKTKANLTSKYMGKYSYGSEVEKTRIGTIFIYPESDSSILFYIDLNRGTPSFNMGSDYGRVKIINGFGTYYSTETEGDKGCKWSIEFIENALRIKTINNQDNCGFGYGVFVDGTFTQITKTLIDHFENQEGTTMYFKDIK